MKSPADNPHEDVLPALEGRPEVMLGLALDASRAEGDCPSLEDIAAWYDGTLPQGRVERVKQHVARCRQCYAVWFGILECSASCAANESAAPSVLGRALAACAGWLTQPRSWGLIATGLATAGAAAAFLIVSGQSSWMRTIDRGYESLSGAVALAEPSAARWPWGSGLGERGIENPWKRLEELRVSHEHEAARAAFGVGVRAGLHESLHDTSEWSSVLATLPTEPPVCAPAASPKACKEINTVFQGVGRWAVLLHFACLLDRRPTEAAPPDATFWDDQIDVLGRAGSAIDANLPSDAFGRFFSDWQAEALKGEDARAVLCAREASLLSLGLD